MIQKIYLNNGSSVQVTALLLVVLLIMSGCTKPSDWEEVKMENPQLSPLSLEEMVEYIDIYHLKCDKTEEQIMAGEDYTLVATEKTAELLFRINFFTNGLHVEPTNRYPTIESAPPLNEASEKFLEDYQSALSAKERFTGYLTAHWLRAYPFLRVEHVEFYPAEMYWFYKSIPEDILRRVYVELEGMFLTQYFDIMVMYRLEWDKDFWLEYDGTGSLIKDGDHTEKRIAYLNELFLTEPRFHRERDIMQEYGLSENNPLSFDWIIAHPKEAYGLATATWEPYFAFTGVRHRICDDNWFVHGGIPFFPEDSEFKKEFVD